MADLSVNAAAVQASDNAITYSQFRSGAAISAGQLCYLDPATNTWKLFDTDAGSGAGANVSDQRGIALNNAASGQPIDVCIKDIYFTPGATLTNGVTVYGSRNAGAITGDVPASGNYPVILGTPRSASILNLNPIAGGVAV